MPTEAVVCLIADWNLSSSITILICNCVDACLGLIVTHSGWVNASLGQEVINSWISGTGTVFKEVIMVIIVRQERAVILFIITAVASVIMGLQEVRISFNVE